MIPSRALDRPEITVESVSCIRHAKTSNSLNAEDTVGGHGTRESLFFIIVDQTAIPSLEASPESPAYRDAAAPPSSDENGMSKLFPRDTKRIQLKSTITWKARAR